MHSFRPKDPDDPPFAPRVCGVCGYEEIYFGETPVKACTLELDFDRVIDRCECGGAKVGYKKGEIGHSRWCNWHTDKVKK